MLQSFFALVKMPEEQRQRSRDQRLIIVHDQIEKNFEKGFAFGIVQIQIRFVNRRRIGIENAFDVRRLKIQTDGVIRRIWNDDRIFWP